MSIDRHAGFPGHGIHRFVRPDLISLVLVSEDGREFYAERTDYHRDACSDFVRETVLPLLGRVPSAACSRSELRQRLRDWFEQLPEPATIIYDFEGDWLLLANAIGRSKKTAMSACWRRYGAY